MTLGKNDVLPLKQWIVWPALLTLAVSLLRLTGELMGWSQALFGRAAGGGASLIGIAWLVPIFGLFFGSKLMRHELGPRSIPKTALAYLGILLASVAVLMLTFGARPLVTFSAWVILTLVVVASASKVWPDLSKLLVGYGLAARIPVVIIMLLAMMGNWGTHYDVAPPELQTEGWSLLYKWFAIGLIPQFTAWMIYTVTVGGLFGCLAALVSDRRRG